MSFPLREVSQSGGACGNPPLGNTAPLFENDAHGAEGSASPLGPEAQQVNAFLRPAGDVEQFCTGPCDPN